MSGSPPRKASGDYFIDCGIARIDLDSTCCCTCTKDSTKVDEAVIVDLDIGGDSTLRDVRSVINDVAILTEKVFKVGRTTGKTVGIVTLVGAPLSADPPPDHPSAARVNAVNLIKIKLDTASMPYVNTLQERNVFAALRTWLVGRGLSFRAVFWTTGVMAFFLSPLLDNLVHIRLLTADVRQNRATFTTDCHGE
jgi:hypothetical protein